MNKIKRLWLLAITMCATLGASAYDAYIDDIYYNFSGTNATVTYKSRTGDGAYISYQYYSDYSGNVIIPERVTYNNVTYDVTTISGGAFGHSTGMTSITIPASVTSIGEGGFTGCTSLSEITFLDGNGTLNLSYKQRFKSSSYGNSGQDGQGLFYDCPISRIYLGRNLSFSSGVETGYSPFYNKYYEDRLKEVIIGKGVTSIANNTFYKCKGLTSVTINSNAFASKSYTTSSTLANIFGSQVTEYIFGCDEQGVGIGEYACYNCKKLTTLTIGNGVTSIGGSAFQGCTGLTSLTIPNNVTAIGSNAFHGCTGLTELTMVNGPKIAYDGYDVTNDISGYEKRTMQWVWDTSRSRWFILNNEQEYELYGVYGKDKTTGYEGKLVIVDGHEWEYSAGQWNDLGSVTDTQVVEYIERNSENTGYIDLGETFKTNTRIQLKYYPTNAGGRAILGDWNTNDNDDWRVFFSETTLYYDFDSSRQQTSKELNTLYEWEIGNYYVKDINSETNNVLNGEVHTDFTNRTHNILLGTHGGATNGDEGTDYGRVYYVKIFEGETLVKDFVPYYDGTAYGLWDNVGGEAYMPTGMWTGEKTGIIEYPKYYSEKEMPYVAVTLSIGDAAFSNCSGLTFITIPNNVTSVGVNPFSGCMVLESIVVESGNTVYDSRNGCNAIVETASNTLITGCKNTIIPNNVTGIGESAFYGCTDLTTITIPSSVTSIGESAFNCSNLTTVIVKWRNPLAITSSVFPYRTQATLGIPQGTLTDYRLATYWQDFKDFIEMETTAPSIVLNKEAVVLYDIGESEQLTATVTPSNGNTGVTWRSYNESVCTVVDGLVLATGYGMTVVTATTADGTQMAVCTVTVKRGIPGDLNRDGKIGLIDLQILVQVLVGKEKNYNFYNADVNEDGQLTLADLTRLVNLLQ